MSPAPGTTRTAGEGEEGTEGEGEEGDRNEKEVQGNVSFIQPLGLPAFFPLGSSSLFDFCYILAFQC